MSRRRIIIGYDGSPGSEDALALGEYLCDAYAAEPIVACCVEFPTYLMDPLELGMAVDEETDPVFDSARCRLGVESLEIRKLVDKSPARALNALAEEIRPVAVVIGSSRMAEPGLAGSGKVSRGMLTGAVAPVAIAPRGYAETALTSFGTRGICVGIDENEESEVALREGAMLALRLRVPLRIVSVLEFPPFTYGPLPGASVADLDEVQTRFTAHVLESAAGRMPDGIDVEVESLVGDPGRELAGISRGFDLMLVGSRGYGPLRRVLLGSVSRHLTNHSHCPLLVTPRHALVEGSLAAVAPRITTAG